MGDSEQKEKNCECYWVEIYVSLDNWKKSKSLESSMSKFEMEIAIFQIQNFQSHFRILKSDLIKSAISTF